MSEKGVCFLIAEIVKAIKYCRLEFDMNYVELLGVLERIKHNTQCEIDIIEKTESENEDNADEYF